MNIPIISNGVAYQPRSGSPRVNVNRQHNERSPNEKRPAKYSHSTSRKPSQPSITNSLGKPTLQYEPDAFKVYVRARPISEKELSSAEPSKQVNIIKKEDNIVRAISLIFLK